MEESERMEDGKKEMKGEDEEENERLEGLKMLRSRFILRSSPEKFEKGIEEEKEGDEEKEEVKKEEEEDKEDTQLLKDQKSGEEEENEEEEEEEEVPLEVILQQLVMKEREEEEEGRESINQLNLPCQSSQERRPCTRKISLGALVNDFVDDWEETLLSFTPTSVSASHDTVFICKKGKGAKWLPISLLRHSKSTWSSAKWKADGITVNDSGSLIARHDSSLPFILTAPLSPSTTEWLQLQTENRKVHSLSLSSRDAWMVVDGGVQLAMSLPDQAVSHFVECEWTLRSITAADNAVWAIREDGSLVVRVGFTKNRRFGEDWVNVSPFGPSRLLSVALFSQSAFVIDDQMSLWRADRVDEHTPFGGDFYRVPSPLDDPMTHPSPDSRPPCITVSSGGVFISIGRRLIYSTGALSAHTFVHQLPDKLRTLDAFSSFTAGAYSTDDDSQSSRLFVTFVSNKELVSIRPLSSNIMPFFCQQAVQLLDTIHIVRASGSRMALIDEHGRNVMLDMNTTEAVLHEESDPIISFALSSGHAIWAVDCDGRILYSTSFHQIEWNELHGETADKVFCSPNGRYVWILREGIAWARDGIIALNPAGTQWITSPSDVRLKSLAVGDSIVYGLTEDGQLMRLRKLSAAQVAGREWSRIAPNHRFSAISLDANGSLWLLDEDRRLMAHEFSIYRPH